ncbi:MAG: alpha-amylase, partial [Pararheinheimera sp.]|nr:alpha-amylase [Rheinheimera sp.]
MLNKSLLTLALALALTGCGKAPEQTTNTASVETPAAVPQTVAQSAQATNPWWQDAVFYQIWPRSFYDTNGDGTGDFKGIEAKLPYLQDLGINAIWLTPMFEAPSYHGYDFTEFYQVEQDYGSMQDFEQLVQAAKAKNINIILDLVINHISDKHEWFQRSAKGEAPYKDYFVWRDELPSDGWGPAWSTEVKPEAVWHYNEERKAYYYAAFGASQPDLNLKHPDVIAEMKKMAKFWLDKGVAGFRLDAVRYVQEDGPQQRADTQGTI